MFTVSCTSDKIWNLPALIEYLAANQNQDINLRLEPEAICLEHLGLYQILDKFQFRSVTIRTWNPLEHHDQYRIYKNPIDFWFSKTPQHSESPFLNTHSMLCFYHRPTAGRLGLASYVYKNYIDNAVMHFSPYTVEDYRLHYELDKLFQWDIKSMQNAAELIPKLPILLSDRSKLDHALIHHNGYDYSDPLTKIYDNIFVDLVVESHVAGQTFFPTEKTVRPMLLGRPFIIFASQNYLEYLRQMGFKTFWQFWDEDYDGYEKKTRLLKIYQLIDYIAGLTAKQRADLFNEIKPILDHNRNLILKRQWSNKITLIND